MKKLCSIIMPTYNNVEMLISSLNSITLSCYGPLKDLLEIIVVNNGDKGIRRYLNENIILVENDFNLGWEAGLKAGLEITDAPFVIFSNDDIRMIPGIKDWFWKMMATFNDPTVGAVGPCSNFVAGSQNNFLDIEYVRLSVKYLIGFFMLIRRKALDEAGGVDENLPGGDDIDLSIRLRDCGYKLIVRRDVYVHHHGQVTGKRVHDNYWDSDRHHESTYNALIRKHGMFKFWETWIYGAMKSESYSQISFASEDVEGDLCRKHVVGDKILELGCGGRKTVENSVGVDILNPGAPVPFVPEEMRCMADLNSDVSIKLPVDEKSQDCIIARHILEHCHDTLGTLAVWNRALKFGGILIVATPNHELSNVIMMNPEHVAALTPTSLKNAAGVCGFEERNMYRDVNGTSFVGVYEKIGHAHPKIFQPLAIPMPLAARLQESCT